MIPLQPEQATFLLQAVHLPTLKNEHRITKKVIEAIPDDKSDYRPDPVSKSAIDLAWHIAWADNLFLDAVASGRFNFAGGSGRPDAVRTSQEVAAWYEDAFQKNVERLTETSSDQLVKVIDFRGVFQLPAIMFLQAGLSHSIHHRGQLTMYLRPMGAKVPSIYGESYDDAQARKSA